MPSTRSCPAGLPSVASLAVTSRHVVDDLEAQAEVLAEPGKRVERRVVETRSPCRRSDTTSRKRRGLAFDRGEVELLAAVDVEEVLQLEHLTAAQLADRVGQQPGDVGAERSRERRCPGEQEVAGEDRDDVLQRAFTLGTPRRVSASSITSSWYSDPGARARGAAPVMTASLAGVSPPRAA